MTRFRGVMFDLDGTLLDTIEDIAYSMNQVLQRNGWELHSIEQYKLFVGDGVEELVRRSLPPDPVILRNVSQYLHELKEIYNNHWSVYTHPYQGTTDFLQSLRSRDLLTAVLSNKPDEFACKCIRHFFPQIEFNSIRGAREGIPRKPDPFAALEICTDLDTQASQWIYAGDSGLDMIMAQKAGMTPVGVLWGFRSYSELSDAGAQRLIHQWNQLNDLLEH